MLYFAALTNTFVKIVIAHIKRDKAVHVGCGGTDLYIPLRKKEMIPCFDWQTHPLPAQEHPILGQPFYQLHPCRTAAVMSQLLRSPDTSSTSATLSDAVERITRQRSRENQEATALGGESNENDIAEVACTGQGGSQEIVAVGDACRDNYLVAWASAMGRVVGLHLPAEYALAVDDTIGI